MLEFLLWTFQKHFDNVKHSLIGRKYKSLNKDPYTVNWYLSFLRQIVKDLFSEELPINGGR